MDVTAKTDPTAPPIECLCEEESINQIYSSSTTTEKQIIKMHGM
jgi:hypothetical protein